MENRDGRKALACWCALPLALLVVSGCGQSRNSLDRELTDADLLEVKKSKTFPIG